MSTSRDDAIRSLRQIAGEPERFSEPRVSRNFIPFSPDELWRLRERIVAATDTLANQQDGG